MATTNLAFDLALARAIPYRGINLTHEKDFRLGAVLVEPSRLRISRPDFPDLSIEPRVMQVLATLHEACGAVVGRDDLIESCWGGRIVGENSINRVISLLRRASEKIGKDSFEIETVPKVGYRLSAPGIASAVDTETPSTMPAEHAGSVLINRRRMIGDLAAAGVGALAAAGATNTAPFALAWWPVPFLSIIGELDFAFDILSSHYLWEGRLAPPTHAARGPLSRRDTSLLFMPTLANVRRDPRFARMVEEIGLADQFRASGKWPKAWQRTLQV